MKLQHEREHNDKICSIDLLSVTKQRMYNYFTLTLNLISSVKNVMYLCWCVGFSVYEQDCSERCGWLFTKSSEVVGRQLGLKGSESRSMNIFFFAYMCEIPLLHCYSLGVSTIMPTISVMSLISIWLPVWNW